MTVSNSINVAESNALVSLRSVRKVYQADRHPTVALADVSADFAAGKLHAVIGRSGAGKSTLLNMIAGIDRVSEGQVYVDATPIHTLSEDRLAAWRGRNVGVVYQSFELLPTLSLLDNVLLPMQFAGTFHPLRSPAWAMELLGRVGLADHAYKRPAEVSGGQRQRTAIARSLANRPRLLVADEPTGSLDEQTALAILDLLSGLVEGGMTVIMVTHDASLADRADTCHTLTDGYLTHSRPSAEAHIDTDRRDSSAHLD